MADRAARCGSTFENWCALVVTRPPSCGLSCAIVLLGRPSVSAALICVGAKYIWLWPRHISSSLTLLDARFRCSVAEAGALELDAGLLFHHARRRRLCPVPFHRNGTGNRFAFSSTRDSLVAARAFAPFLLLAVACWLMLTLCCVRDQLYVKEIADLCMFHEESMEAVSVRLLGPLAWCAWLTVLCRRIISFAVQTGVAVDKLK